jgi:hypothetical protein
MTMIVLDLPRDEAITLAQMCKRFIYDDAVRFSTKHDGGEERDNMMAAIYKLYAALKDSGINPR